MSASAPTLFATDEFEVAADPARVGGHAPEAPTPAGRPSGAPAPATAQDGAPQAPPPEDDVPAARVMQDTAAQAPQPGGDAPAGPVAPAVRPVPRLEIAPCPVADVLRLERELGVSHPVAQVLVRRGFADPDAARAWLAADEAHDASAFAGIGDAVALILRHVADRTPITVHGDYDVDGVCSTAILVRVLRRLGADVGFYLPSRLDDGYGLAAHTVDRLAANGTRLLITADCAITAVDEVARARATGMDVVVTDHHAPRADGALPDAPVVHPALCGYPCPELCAAGVAYKLAGALLASAGEDPAGADEDLDLVALATVADVVALTGENRRLVRAGLRALAATRKPGLRALMKVAKVDPSRVDAGTLGFRLAPRINAAGRLYRADAGLELVLTDDPGRAREVAEELDRVNHERRHTEQRILFAAEAQVAQYGPPGDQPAYVLCGDDWHPGVVGIVASRIAERYHRPAVLIAMDGHVGTGSARSVPGFDLLGALDACAEHLERHGGHRAAAGLEIARHRLDAFRAAFCAHADAALTPDLREPVERVDAVVAGDELGLALAEDLERLAPFGQGNPGVSLLVPAATLTDPRPMGENRHVRFTVEAGGVRARAVAFGTAGKLPCEAPGPVDATFTLEINEWNGTIEPRLVLRAARPTEPPPIEIVGDEPWLEAALAEFDAPLHPAPPGGEPVVRDRRGGGLAGTIGALVASGEPVLVVCAHTALRARHLRGRLGGFALTSHAALQRDPQLAARFAHVVVLDPPAAPAPAVGAGPVVHLAYGGPEVDFAVSIHERERDLRTTLTAIYRALRDRGAAAGEALEAALREGDPQRSPAQAGRALRVLAELGLVHLDRERQAVSVPAPERTELDRSEAFRAYSARSEDERRFLTSSTTATQPAATAAA
jgi:single-stranded-DNA-specific exonuclease